MPDCWLEVSIRKVLRPATTTQASLGFPVFISKCWDGSQGSQVATARFSCSPPDLNFLDSYFTFMYMHNNHCHRVTANLQLNILLLLLLLLLLSSSSSSSSSSGEQTCDMPCKADTYFIRHASAFALFSVPLEFKIWNSCGQITQTKRQSDLSLASITTDTNVRNLIKPADYVMHQQFNIQQLYALSTLYLCVLYLSENKQRLVPLTA